MRVDHSPQSRGIAVRQGELQQALIPVLRDSIVNGDLRSMRKKLENDGYDPRKWKVQTAVGGGPVLIQNGLVHITNNEEYRFAGKAIDDRHPRTAMGYTKDRKLIILVVEGRNPGIAEGGLEGKAVAGVWGIEFRIQNSGRGRKGGREWDFRHFRTPTFGRRRIGGSLKSTG